jgi:hypothetical protein
MPLALPLLSPSAWRSGGDPRLLKRHLKLATVNSRNPENHFQLFTLTIWPCTCAPWEDRLPAEVHRFGYHCGKRDRRRARRGG